MVNELMQIRLAGSADVPMIRQYDCHIPEERLAACIDAGNVLVLCDGNRIVGVFRYCLFWQTIPFLDLIYIDESYRGRSHGSRMMTHWENLMTKQGCRYAMTSTQEDETARFFYEKLGYRRVGAFLPPEQDADELVYLKELKV